MIRPHRRNLVQWAADKPDVLVLSADLTSSCEADGFRDAYPDRFFSMGMAEQAMIGFAGGLAREGFTPLVHSFGVFLTRRVYDQVAMAVAYPNLRVRLLGFLPGITTPGGATHQATDDVALMRALPNMTVLACGDASEVCEVLELAHGVDGPVYIRMLRGEVPTLFDSPMQLGRARVLCAQGRVALLTSGICTEQAMRARAALDAAGLPTAQLHISTLKPLDDPAILDVIASCEAVLTVENHSVIGGLGSAVAERMAEAGLARPLRRLGLQDTFSHGASRAWLLAEHGLDAPAIAAAVQQLVGTRLQLDPDLLAALPLSAGPADRAEDL